MRIDHEEKLLIADVGASGGVHPRWDKFKDEIFFILFEPDVRASKKLQAEFSSSKAFVSEVALSDCKKSTTLYLTKKQAVSSLLKPNSNICSRFYNSERFNIIDETSLEVDSLDSAIGHSPISELDFIKIDTQGTELDILKGATKNLERIIGIECEVEFLPFYKNQPLFAEVDVFVRNQGFELFDLRRSYYQRSSKRNFVTRGQITAADALYFRTPENIIDQFKGDTNKLIKAYKIYLAYGYPDQAEALLPELEKAGVNIEELTKLLTPFLDTGVSFKGQRIVHQQLLKLSKIWNRFVSYFTPGKTMKRKGIAADKILGN